MGRIFAPTRVDRLPNGLQVLTRELHHAPVASVMVWYGVGSRNERPGVTGISHFLEHMMFKGTPKFPYGVLEEGVKRRGGMWNAFTSYDYTAYFEVLPSRHIEYGLEVEADRMVNMRFDPDLTVRERGIIVSEREGYENRPTFWLMEAFMAEAYQEFPYRHHVLGTKEDIRAMTAEALTEHYQRFYRPNNAILVAVGDFETERLLAMAEKYYGHLPAGDPVEPLTQTEPEQTAERRVTVRRPGPNPYVMAGYKIPGSNHSDIPALQVLATVLSGSPSFSAMGGGGAMGRSSRLYRRLVNKGIATSTSGYPWTLQYPGLFMLSATPVPGTSLERVEEALFAEVEALRQERVAEDEFQRALKQVRASYIYAMESAMNQAIMLGATALTRGVDRFDRALEELEAVTPDDLLRVAQQYLDPQRRTVGQFVPEEKAASATAAAPKATSRQEAAVETGSTPEFQKAADRKVARPEAGKRNPILDQERIVRRSLPNGATLLVYPAATIPSAFVRVQMEAGAVHEPPAKAGLAQLTGQLLTRGSEAFTAEELALKTDALGMSVRVDVGRETAVATLKCLPEDLQTGLEILAEVIRRPTFPADEMGRMRDRMLVAVREANNDTRSVAARQLAELIYPENHPYRHPVNGTEESLAAIAGEDLAAFHSAHYGPNGAVITVVGNVEPAALEAALTRAFEGWSGGEGRKTIPAVEPPAGSRTHLSLEGKTQTDIALGWPLVDRSHPDYLALDFLATLFGGNGTPASSRLFRDVREKYGLSYYQFASFGGSSGPAAWTAHIGVNPARLQFAVETLTAELKRLAEEAIPGEEMQALQDFLEDFPAVQHESPERVAARLAEVERFNLGLDYVERYPKLVAALAAGQLQEVARRHLDPSRLTVVTVGPEADEATS
ncbi:MAG: M16 family metallopeptidase [Bacillota bacterium]